MPDPDTIELIGNSAEMWRLRENLKNVLDCDQVILLSGETGTGKDVAARWLHFNSSRASAPFVEANVPVIPAELAESTLFGHVRGAFTGATKDRRGLVASAERGTLLINEIGDASAELQPKLLRLIERGVYEKVGSDGVRTTEAAIILATHRPLDELTRSGAFRGDLFYRIGRTIWLPPLRDRIDDIPLLAEHFNRQTAIRRRRQPLSFENEAIECLKRWEWPGNVREFEHFVVGLFVSPADIVDRRAVEEEFERRRIRVPLSSRGVGRTSDLSRNHLQQSTREEGAGRVEGDRLVRCAVAALDILLLGGTVQEASDALMHWESANPANLAQHQTQHRRDCEAILERASHDWRPVDSIDNGGAELVLALSQALSGEVDSSEQASESAGSLLDDAIRSLNAACHLTAGSEHWAELYLAALVDLTDRLGWSKADGWSKWIGHAVSGVGPSRSGPGKAAVVESLTRSRNVVHCISQAQEVAKAPPVLGDFAPIESVTDPDLWNWHKSEHPHICVQDVSDQVERSFRAWERGTVRYNARRVVIRNLPTQGATDVEWGYTRYFSCSADEGSRIGVNVLLEVGDDLILQNRDTLRVSIAAGQLAATAGGAFALAPTGSQRPLHAAALNELQKELWQGIPLGPHELTFLGAFHNIGRHVSELVFRAKLDANAMPVLAEHCVSAAFAGQTERFEATRSATEQPKGTTVPPYFRVPIALIKRGDGTLCELSARFAPEVLLGAGGSHSRSRDAVQRLVKTPIGVVLRGSLALWRQQFADSADASESAQRGVPPFFV